MTFNISLAPAADFASTSKTPKGESQVRANRAQFVDMLGQAVLQAEESGEALVLVIPLNDETTVQNQLTSIRRYANHAADELGIAVTVSKVRNEDVAVIRPAPAPEATAPEGETQA